MSTKPECKDSDRADGRHGWQWEDGNEDEAAYSYCVYCGDLRGAPVEREEGDAT